jgi:predicted amidohydrolase
MLRRQEDGVIASKPTIESQRHAPVTVAIAQLNSALGEVEANWRQAVEAITAAADQGAQLIVFPECYLQGYRADHLFAERAVALSDPLFERVRALATEREIWIVLGLARAEESYPHLVYNSAALIGPNMVVDWYDKVHLGTYLNYQEGVFFAPGNRIPIFDLPFGRVGIQICYDISFPETSRTLAVQGAEINIVLSAGPDEFRRRWDGLLEVRTNENLWWTVYANCVGDQCDTHFFGGSRIVGPDGTVRTQGPFDEPSLVVGEVDLDEARLLRRKTHRFRDRVPELYRPIVERRGR